MKFDQLIMDFFKSTEEFSVAMKLLYDFTSENLTLEEFEHLGLDEKEVELLHKAKRFTSLIRGDVESLKQQVTFPEELVNKGDSTEIKEYLKQLLEDMKPSISEANNPTLRKYFDEWCEETSSELDIGSYENTYLPVIKLFNDFILDYTSQQDLRVNDLEPEQIREFQKFYRKIPSGAVIKGKTFSEVVGIPEGKEKSPATIETTFSVISSYLHWGMHRSYAINGNLTSILRYVKSPKTDKNRQKKRVAIEDEELTRFFNSDHYIKGTHKTSGMYWVPLIALLTGARMAEIVQLEKHNIVQSKGGIWYFDITDEDSHISSDEGKKLKALGSKRQVPIHNILLKDLKFMSHVEHRTGRLFPDEPRNKNGKFDAFQKRQATYRRQINVIPSHDMEMKDFHSFRHTVRTRLSEIRSMGRSSDQFDEGLIDAIMGHSSRGRSIGETTYNHSQYLESKSKALSRLKYDSIDFKQIIPWEKCLFYRKEMRQNFQRKLNT